MLNVFSVEHASSMGPAVMEEGEEKEEEQQASCLVAKQAVEFPQVLTSINYCEQDEHLCADSEHFIYGRSTR